MRTAFCFQIGNRSFRLLSAAIEDDNACAFGKENLCSLIACPVIGADDDMCLASWIADAIWCPTLRTKWFACAMAFTLFPNDC